MKPYDKSNSFMRRVTKRVSELIPGTSWMNSFLGESQADDDPTSTNEHDVQPPVKKLCTSNNTFANTQGRTFVDTSVSQNSTDNHNSSHTNPLLPGISAITCLPSTSRQSPKFLTQSSSSLLSHEIGNRSSLKRKSDGADLSSTIRQSPKTLAFNFASSTPATVTSNKHPNTSSSLKRTSCTLDKLNNSNEFSTPTSAKLVKSRGNESSLLTFRETSKNLTSPSFNWATFVNYGELSERQKLFAQKSPLNCSQVMYGGNSARSNLSKLLGNTPAIHRKAVIPISPANNSEIRTTSSILLGHISTKDKEIEENKFIIQPKINLRYKSEQKPLPIRVETTVIDVTQEKTDVKSKDTSQVCTGRDTSRKLRANISKKTRGLKSDELEMPAKVDLPNISLAVPVLPNIKLSNDDEDNEFTFNQPLTLEQFSIQIAEKTSKKNQKMILKKTLQKTNIDSSNKCSLNSVPNSINFSNQEILKKDIVSSNVNDKVSELCKPDLQNLHKSPSLKLESKKLENVVFNQSTKVSVSECNSIKQLLPEKLSVEVKKWTCDACWVPNDHDKVKCISCLTPKAGNSQKSLQAVKPTTWTCESCWVPNKNEANACVSCQTPKSETAKKVVEQNNTWTCDACWVKNKSDCTSCISCGTSKSGTTKKVVEQSNTWTCDSCWVKNKSDCTSCISCGTCKPGTTKKIVEQNNTWTCDGCWVKNKSECTSCISCGTSKPGAVSENKPQASSQFKFGLNNNTFDNSSGSQFKFGFVSGKSDESPNKNKPINTDIVKTTENVKPEVPVTNFKFGMVNSKTDQPFVSFKFGDDSATSQNVKANEIPNSNNTDQSTNNFKFGFENKLDQSENQLKCEVKTSKSPVTKFKFGSDSVGIQNNLTTDSSKVAPSTNEFKFMVNNKSDTSEKPVELQKHASDQFKFGDKNQTDKLTPEVTFGSVETKCNNSNSLIKTEPKNEDLPKVQFSWNKNNKTIIKPITFGVSPSKSAAGDTNSIQLVNGHSHSNETPNEDQKSGFMKTPQFTFGSLSKQDQNLPDDKKIKTFSFGSASSDNKPFVAPTLASSFSSSGPVFGTNNAMFGSGPTSTSATLGTSSVLTPQFSFGSMAPPASNSFFSKTVNDNDIKPLAQTNNSFTSTTNMPFSFGAQSPPVFSAVNAGGFSKSIQADDQTKSTTNLFNPASTKQTVKLDPNAPISINFTGGATTQFTAQPETTDQPPKRKILKPVRRIR